MADLSQYQDPTGGETQGEFSPLPAGEYMAAIVKSEEKPTKAGTGSYINLELEITDGEFQGRRFWDLLNLNNPNATAVEIANRTLNSICNACGKLRTSVRATDELHGIPMRVKLGVKTDSYGDKNTVKSYAAMNSTPATQGGGQASHSAGDKPWNRGTA